MIKVVIGLGNPGEEYRRSRHNLGFMVVDQLREKLKSSEITRECYSQVFRARFCRHNLLFVKPMTYMNLSGKAAACLCRKYDLLPEEILVIFDDISLPFGEVRVRTRGSSGGHKGMESIREALGTDIFPRVRLGILNEKVDSDLADFVLSDFSAEEQDNLQKVLDYTESGFKNIICRGFSHAQKYFNRKNILQDPEQN